MLPVIYLLLLGNIDFVRVPQKSAPPVLNTNKVWVFFTDKGVFNQSQYLRALDALTKSEKTTPHQQTDFNDLPVRQSYIRQIEALGARLRTTSRWLNAASFDMAPELIPEVYRLPFVYDIRPVTHSSDPYRETTVPITQPSTPARTPDTAEAHRFYGASWDQVQMLGVPEAFFRGYYGSGVKLAIFDTGLKLKNRAVSRIKLGPQYDFISGDNFYYARGNIYNPLPISSLRYLGLVKDPALIATSDKIILTFVADSFNYTYGLPVRAIYVSHSTDLGETWTPAQPLLISRPYNYTYENLNLISRDSVTYLAFNEVNLLPSGQPTCYLGYFVHTTWYNHQSIGSGRSPALAIAADTLYLAYITADSTIAFRKANISQPAPSWILYNQIPAQAPLTDLQIAAGPDGTVNIFALDIKSGKIIHFHSDDGGVTFNPSEPIARGDARMLKLFNHPFNNPEKVLVYLDESNLPFTRLLVKFSNDYGTTWTPAAAAESALAIGGYTLCFSDEIKLVYESAGTLHLITSTDQGATWRTHPPIDTIGFSVAPHLIPVNNAILLVWFRRGDDNALWEDSDTLKFPREQPYHGTRMASIIAGYQPYSMMGIAPGVTLLVARTEFHRTAGNRYYEYNMEEDTYIQALEWAAKCGADVVSTSLGYRDFYRDDQFDGKTAPVSIAADIAAKKGLLIVTAMGNRDTTAYPWPRPYIVAPGDAEGVITCGGVEKNLTPWRGTGTGPTADGRIKPDLVALADTVAVAAPDSENYLEGSVGTSCATALIAGCCALLKEIYPHWTADSIKQALFSTATLAVKSCTFGFGLPRIDSILKIYPPRVPPLPKDEIGAIFPNPFIFTINHRVYFPINLTRVTPEATISIFTVSGTLVKTINLNTSQMPAPGRYSQPAELERIGAFWDGRDENDRPVASGLYLAVLRTTFGRDVRKFALVRQP